MDPVPPSTSKSRSGKRGKKSEQGTDFHGPRGIVSRNDQELFD